MVQEERVYKGYWWLPMKPEIQVAGLLTIDVNGEMRLELYGRFASEDKIIEFEREPDKVIYGRCYAPNGKMKDISLFECYSAYTFNFNSTFPIIRYSCNYGLLGIHTNSMDSPEFFEAKVEFDELLYWCSPNNITTIVKDSSFSVIFDHSKEKESIVSIVLDDGIMISINQDCSYKHQKSKTYIEQSTYIKVEKEGLSGFDIISSARKFERFLSLPMLFPVRHGTITLCSQKCFQEDKNGERHYFPIELVYHSYKDNNLTSAKQYDILFTYKDVADNFEELYKKFYTNIGIAQIWSNFIYSLERKRLFTSNDFLIVAQALDGFAMRFRKEESVEQEYQSLRDEFADIKRIKLTDSDIKSSAGSRNYYSHILKLEKKIDKNAKDGVELFKLTKKLRILLICCLMDFLGIEKTRINMLLNKCNNSIFDC